MKIIKTASGKKTIKISKSEWQSIGKKAGWTTAAFSRENYPISWKMEVAIDNLHGYAPKTDEDGKQNFDFLLKQLSDAQREVYEKEGGTFQNDDFDVSSDPRADPQDTYIPAPDDKPLI